MNVIARPDARDWHSLPYDGADYVKKLGKGVKGLRIAYSPTLGYVDVDPEIARAVEKAVKVLADLGAMIEQVDPGFEDPAPCFRTLWWSGARALLGKLPKEKKAMLDPAWPMSSSSPWRSRLDDYLDAVTRARASWARRCGSSWRTMTCW